MNRGLEIFKRGQSVRGFQKGSSDVSEADLSKYPEWLRDIIRSTPEKPPRKGRQFDPADVPIVPQDPAGNRAYDPTFGREDLMLEAARGDADVLHLQGGIPDLSGARLRETTYGPGSPGATPADLRERQGIANLALRPGDAALPLSVARAYGLSAGDSFTYNGRTYRYADQPKGSVGNVLDVFHPRGGKGGGGFNRAAGGGYYGGVNPASVRGDTGSRAAMAGRDLSMPASWGLGTQFFETPNSFFPRATPAPGTPPVTGQGQVLAGGPGGGAFGYDPGGGGGGPGGYSPGVYTGELGGPSDPEHDGGGWGGTIPRGPFEGFTPQQMDQWHGGQGFGQLGYPSFSGNTAGPGGEQLRFSTTSYDVPGYGWVPQAQLANAQASNNPLDYFNPFGHTSEGGSNTGGPTQRNVGRVVGTASNFLFPGLGFLTGPLARYVTSLIQGGASKQQVQQAVQQVQRTQQTQKLPPMPSGSVPLPTGGGGYAPSARSPTGQAPVGREWWSQDFGRGFGEGPVGSNPNFNPGAAGYGGYYGTRGLGFTGHTATNLATAIGFGGNLGGGGPVGVGALGGGVAARNLMQKMAKGIPLGPSGGYANQSAVFSPGTVVSGPGQSNIVNWGALGGPFSAEQSRHIGQRQTT